MEYFWIALIAIAALVAGLFIGWPILLRRFVRDYYRRTYEPIALNEIDLVGAPEEHHLMDVPWITSPYPLSQSISLQMLAAQYGFDEPRAHFDFLMSFTAGVSRSGEAGVMPLGTDPEVGFVTAAPLLGLYRRYYTADRAELMLRALRLWISRGYAARVALDQGYLYGQTEFVPHSEVLVGYNPAGFFYYETVSLPPSTSAAANRPAGEAGLFVENERLMESMERFSKEMRLPWRYAMTVLESAGEPEEDLTPVWRMQGKAYAEETRYGPRMGAKVLEDVADEVVKEGVKFNLDKLRPGVQLAAQVREDNANYLRETFPIQADLLEAAGHLESAAREYRLIAEDTANGIDGQIEAQRIATRLRAAAQSEREAGKIFLARAAG